ncbi:MAG TPA: hypothetical protein VHP58_06730 [Alphaproteobacteria bacterium]|nr:hypothetical protein [Alphaproteobacteria bacterium]
MDIQGDNVVPFKAPAKPMFDHSADALEKVIGQWNIVLAQHQTPAGIEELITWLDRQLKDHRTVRRFKGMTQRPVQFRDIHAIEPLRIIQPVAVEDFAGHIYLCTAIYTLLQTEPPRICLGMDLPETVYGKLCGMLQKQGVEYSDFSPRIFMPEARYKYLFA